MKSRMHGGAGKELYQRARELRNRSTGAEDILWGYLKSKPLGYKFRRQHPFSIYILDFYCHQLKLVIEVDSAIHNNETVRLNDQQRESLLKQDGMEILRFSNEQVLANLKMVITTIEQYIAHKDEQQQ